MLLKMAVFPLTIGLFIVATDTLNILLRQQPLFSREDAKGEKWSMSLMFRIMQVHNGF